MPRTMKTVLLVESERSALEAIPVSDVQPDDALLRITTKASGGADFRIRKAAIACQGRHQIGVLPSPPWEGAGEQSVSAEVEQSE